MKLLNFCHGSNDTLGSHHIEGSATRSQFWSPHKDLIPLQRQSCVILFLDYSIQNLAKRYTYIFICLARQIYSTDNHVDLHITFDPNVVRVTTITITMYASRNALSTIAISKYFRKSRSTIISYFI